jgi:hypothetical protein
LSCFVGSCLNIHDPRWCKDAYAPGQYCSQDTRQCQRYPYDWYCDYICTDERICALKLLGEACTEENGWCSEFPDAVCEAEQCVYGQCDVTPVCVFPCKECEEICLFDPLAGNRPACFPTGASCTVIIKRPGLARTTPRAASTPP